MNKGISVLLVLAGAAITSMAWTIWYSQSLHSSRLTVAQAAGQTPLLSGDPAERSDKVSSGQVLTRSTDLTTTQAERLFGIEEQLAQLQQALIQEQRDRLQLSRDLALVEAELAQLNSTEYSDSDEPDETPGDVIFTDAAPAGFSDFRGDFSRAGARNEVTDREALVAAGVDEGTAEDLSSRLDHQALALLELRDQAIREDWVRTDRYQSERNLITDSVDVRGELGDSGWDAYLYNSGSNNRVGVTSVLNGSAAANAGIESGDIVLSYAGQRIFTISELQQATREGDRDETVTVNISREESIFTVSLPRGPLGVTLTPGRVDPAESADL